MRGCRCRCGEPMRRSAWRCEWCDLLEYGPLLLAVPPDPRLPRSWWSFHITWGLTMCAFKCMRTAVVILDNDPLCLECAEAAFDRLEAVTMYPRMRELLPSLIEGGHR